MRAQLLIYLVLLYVVLEASEGDGSQSPFSGGPSGEVDGSQSPFSGGPSNEGNGGGSSSGPGSGSPPSGDGTGGGDPSGNSPRGNDDNDAFSPGSSTSTDNSWSNLRAKQAVFNLYSFCAFATAQIPCEKTGQCVWDRNATACFVDEARLTAMTGLNLCQFYIEVVPTMTNENVAAQCRDRTHDLLMFNLSCEVIVPDNPNCTSEFPVSNYHEGAPARLKIHPYHICCDSCGGQPFDVINQTVIPSECYDYDPANNCYDEIEGCEHIVQNDLCLLVSGCDESCGFCDGECADAEGPLTCGQFRALPIEDTDCSSTQKDKCKDSCRQCPHPGFCDVSNAHIEFYQSSTQESFIVPSSGATFGPVAYNLEKRSVVSINQLCSEIQAEVALTGLIAMTQRGNCTFEQKAKNAEAAGAVALFIVNTYKNADLVFIQSDNPDDEARNITIPTRFVDYHAGLLEAVEASDVTALNFDAEIKCSVTYFPQFFCIRNTGGVRIDGEYALGGWHNSQPYYKAWRYDAWIYMFWAGRWAMGTELLSDSRQVYPLIICLTRDSVGQFVRDLLACEDWVSRTSADEPDVLVTATITNRRCGNECDYAEITELFDTVDSESCKNYASYGFDQSSYHCQCVESLWAAGINPTDYPCTIVSSNLGHEALMCLHSGFVPVSVELARKQELCVTYDSDTQFTNWCSERTTDGYIWSSKYICDLRTNRTGVAIWPYSNNCGVEDGSERQVWTWLEEDLSDTECSKIDVSHLQDGGFILELVDDVRLEDSQCGLPEGSVEFESTVDPTSASSLNTFILVATLFSFLLI